MNLDSLKAKGDHGRFVRYLPKINKSEKDEIDRRNFLGDTSPEVTESIKKNLNYLSEKIDKIEKLTLDINEVKKQIATKEINEKEGSDLLLSKLRLYLEELVEVRNFANTFSNVMHDNVIDWAELLYFKSDVLNRKEVEEMNAQHLKNEYDLVVKPVDRGCMGITFNRLITSKIFEKDELFFDGLTEEIRKNCSEFDYDFDEYRTLILCVEQETTHYKPCVQIRDLDKASIGSLINAIAWGTCKSDFSLAMNACLTTYSGDKNITKVFFMTPKFFVEKYLPRFKEIYF